MGRLEQQQSYGESKKEADPAEPGIKRNHKQETAPQPYTPLPIAMS